MLSTFGKDGCPFQRSHSVWFSDSGEKIPRVSGPTAQNVAETRASARPEDPAGQSDALHRSEVRDPHTHADTRVDVPIGPVPAARWITGYVFIVAPVSGWIYQGASERFVLTVDVRSRKNEQVWKKAKLWWLYDLELINCRSCRVFSVRRGQYLLKVVQWRNRGERCSLITVDNVLKARIVQERLRSTALLLRCRLGF